tara:strand:+ start:253 stop:612 length:360 start_codon:yes stop_codon:yes gene_type:complete
MGKCYKLHCPGWELLKELKRSPNQKRKETTNTKGFPRTSNIERRREMKNHQTTSQQEQRQLDEHGEGNKESNQPSKEIEGTTSTSHRPDVVYKDLQIDLDLFEWIIVGIIAIIFILVTR